MEEAAAVRRRTAPSLLETAQTTARHTAEAGAVSTTAAPLQLVPEGTAGRTAGDASSRAAPSQLKPGRRTAERVYLAHSSSRRTVRRRMYIASIETWACQRPFAAYAEIQQMVGTPA